MTALEKEAARTTAAILLGDQLTPGEMRELRAIMRDEPCYRVFLNHYHVSIRDKGLIYRNEEGQWCCNWEHVLSGVTR